MSAGQQAQPAPSPYCERLTPPWWVWIVGVCLPLPLAVAYGSAYGPGVGAATAGVTTALVVTALRMTAPGIAVSPEGIRAGRALLPLVAVGTVQVLTGPELVTRRRDPHAYLAVRAWTSPIGVAIEVLDANDPHGCWIVTSRRPALFVAAVEACRPRRPAAGPGATD